MRPLAIMPPPPTLPAPAARVPANRWELLEPPELGSTAPTLPVSVIVTPVREATLAACLGALSAQSYPSELLQVVVAASGPPQDGIAAPNLVLVDLPRQGLRAGLARNRGADAADGDVLVFVDGDVALGACAIEAHARWYHVAGDVVTLGSSAARPPEGGADGFDLVRATSSTNLGVAAAVFRDAGGFAGHELPVVDEIEFGYRLYNAGCVFVPEPQARGRRAAPAGPATSATTDDPRTALHLAACVPLPRARDSAPGRSYAVPRTLVVVPVADEPPSQAASAVEAVLAGDDHDLVVRIVAAPDRARRELTDRFLGDPRVEVVADPGSTASPIAAPYQVWAPPTAVLSRMTLRRLVALLATGRAGVVHVTVPGCAPADVLVRGVTTRALARARRVAGDADPYPVIGELFGEEWHSGADFGISAFTRRGREPAQAPVDPDVPLAPERLLALLGRAEEERHRTEAQMEELHARERQRSQRQCHERQLQKRLEADRQRYRQRIQRLEADRDKHRHDVKDARDRSRRRIQRLKADRDKLRGRIEHLEADRETLRARLDAMAAPARSGIVRRALRRLRSWGQPGRRKGAGLPVRQKR